MEEIEDFGSIPTEHIERSFDALLDTVTGNEGMSLTNNQIYMRGVLETNRMIQRSVSGNEGFFSGIASAAKSMYDYIVKMFKSIINFFFGTGSKTENVEQDIKTANTSVNDATKKITNPPFKAPNDQPTKDLKVAIAEVIKDPDTMPEEKAKAEELVVILEATPPPSSSVVKAVSHKFADINIKKQKQIKNQLEVIKTQGGSLIDHLTKLYNEKEKYKAGGESYKAYCEIIDALHEDTSKGVKTALNQIEDALLITDANGGPRILAILGFQIKRIESVSSLVKAFRTNLETRVSRCEKVLGFKGDHAELKKEAELELKIAKELVVLINGIGGYVHNACAAVTKASGLVTKLFGVK